MDNTTFYAVGAILLRHFAFQIQKTVIHEVFSHVVAKFRKLVDGGTALQNRSNKSGFEFFQEKRRDLYLINTVEWYSGFDFRIGFSVEISGN